MSHIHLCREQIRTLLDIDYSFLFLSSAEINKARNSFSSESAPEHYAPVCSGHFIAQATLPAAISSEILYQTAALFLCLEHSWSRAIITSSKMQFIRSVKPQQDLVLIASIRSTKIVGRMAELKLALTTGAETVSKGAICYSRYEP